MKYCPNIDYGTVFAVFYDIEKLTTKTGKMKNIVLFGAPGAGKGTHANLIAEKFNMVHISTGDLLRREVADATPLGLRVKAIMDRGDLVGDDIVIKLVDQVISSYDEGLILDGFPRTVEQAQALEFLLSHHGKHLDHVISIDMPREILVKRIHERALISNRSDDTEETINHRLEEYELKTKPVLDYYKGSGILISIDGSGEISETSNRICKILEKMLS